MKNLSHLLLSQSLSLAYFSKSSYYLQHPHSLKMAFQTHCKRVRMCVLEKKQATHCFTACSVFIMHKFKHQNTCTKTTMKAYVFIIMQLWTPATKEEKTDFGETSVWCFLYTWLGFTLCWRAIKAFFPFIFSLLRFFYFAKNVCFLRCTHSHIFTHTRILGKYKQK